MERGMYIIFALVSACTAVRVPHRSDSASIEVAYPQSMTMDRFEAMLQRASQILRPPAQVVEPTLEPSEHRDQDENYYMPVFHAEKSHKLDAKSRQMQYMVPPPAEDNQEANFYVIKQRKLPKKFRNASKQLNVKIIADGERGAVQQPAGGGYSNDHNLIFDDTFFGIDAQAAVPDDVPQAQNTEHGFIAPIYSRRFPKSEDMFATSASKREARMRVGRPMTRFSIVSY